MDALTASRLGSLSTVAGWGSVFISHTSDMAAFPSGRSFARAAAEAVLKAGLRPVDMAQFAAREDAPAEYCRRRVTECDLYLAVVGFRHGSQVPGRADGVSYTELEFLAATEAGMPRLVFVLDEDVAVPRSLVDKDSGAIDGFREKLHRASVIVKTFANPVDLGEAVLHALYEQRLHQLRTPNGAGATRRGDGGDRGGDGGGAGWGAADGHRRPWMAPPVDRMVERPEVGNRLVAALTVPGPAEVSLTTGLAGAGGFGKTTLASWVCHQPEIDRRYPGGLLWVTVGQDVHGPDLAEKVNDLAFALSGARPALSDPDAAGAELGRLTRRTREAYHAGLDEHARGSQPRRARHGRLARQRPRHRRRRRHRHRARHRRRLVGGRHARAGRTDAAPAHPARFEQVVNGMSTARLSGGSLRCDRDPGGRVLFTLGVRTPHRRRSSAGRERGPRSPERRSCMWSRPTWPRRPPVTARRLRPVQSGSSPFIRLASWKIRSRIITNTVAGRRRTESARSAGLILLASCRPAVSDPTMHEPGLRVAPPGLRTRSHRVS
jgi:hypothetical protein